MKVKSITKKYRPNVAIVVLNTEGKILTCRRADNTGAWQLPQGGIEPGENPEQAMRRELLEETNLSNISLIGCLPEAIRYDWPKHLFSRGYHGQEQTYFLVRIAPEAIISFSHLTNIEVEFDAFEWLSRKEFESRISGFKIEAYKNGIKQLDKLFPGLIKP